MQKITSQSYHITKLAFGTLATVAKIVLEGSLHFCLQRILSKYNMKHWACGLSK